MPPKTNHKGHKLASLTNGNSIPARHDRTIFFIGPRWCFIAVELCGIYIAPFKNLGLPNAHVRHCADCVKQPVRISRIEVGQHSSNDLLILELLIGVSREQNREGKRRLLLTKSEVFTRGVASFCKLTQQTLCVP